VNLIDTHCHINFPDAFPDPAAAIREAQESGVRTLVVIGIDLESCKRALRLAEEHENVFAVVGIHPNYAHLYDAHALAEVRRFLSSPKAVALGEIGLDYHWDFATPDQQRLALVEQLDLAAQLDLPVVFHCRKAYGDLLALLEARPAQPYLFHCFSGDRNDARRALDLGGVLGVDGPITYKSAKELREIVAETPLDQIVLETDSPYMTPEPHRGKPNKPAYIPFINNALAATKRISAEESATATTANARRFFRLP
jgi:TatD DNase family protein